MRAMRTAPDDARSARASARAAAPAKGDRGDMVAAGVLACVTLVAVPGARGILGSTRSLAPLMVAAVAMHLVAWVTRRRFGPAGFLVAMAASPLLAAWLAFPGTTVLGVPWARTWRSGTDGLRRVLEALGTGQPPGLNEPVSLLQGRLALAVLCVAVCALMADQAAFRIRQASLALLPSFTLVLLGATRAPSEHRSQALATYLAVAMAFLLAHRAAGIRATATARTGRAPIRLGGMAPAGAVLALASVVTALVVGPRLPGFGLPPVVAAPGSVLARQSAGVELSSLVDLSPALSDRTDQVLFTVSSPVAAYWRLTSLDTFDGRVWSQRPVLASSGAASTGLRERYVPGVPVVQEFEMRALRSAWLPAAYRPQRVDGAAGYLVSGDSSSVRRRKAVGAGERYQVASLIPQLTGPDLRRVDSQAYDPALSRYLALPPLPGRVTDEAERVTRPARQLGAYAVALALQRYFRGGFTYDLNVSPSHDEDALVRFLFRTRRGYCEQFAAAFAVMARSVGLPARVAVGFTPGQQGRDGRYEVRGLNAHAWPEVYIEGSGWVAFEPTPGRGMPGAESYTGVPAAQASFQPEEPVGPGPTTSTPTTTTTLAPTQTTDGVLATSSTQPVGPGPAAPLRAGEPGTTPGPTSQEPAGLPVVPFTAVGLAALGTSAVPLAKRRRRHTRRRQAAGPNDRVMVAWTEAAEALAASGLGRRPSETLLDHAARAARDTRFPQRLAEPVLALADQAGTACYSGRRVAAEQVAESNVTAAAIEAALRSTTPLHRRLRRSLDPRPLWRRRSVINR